jgi:hypothetical protein
MLLERWLENGLSFGQRGDSLKSDLGLYALSTKRNLKGNGFNADD